MESFQVAKEITQKHLTLALSDDNRKLNCQSNKIPPFLFLNLDPFVHQLVPSRISPSFLLHLSPAQKKQKDSIFASPVNCVNAILYLSSSKVVLPAKPGKYHIPRREFS